MGAGWAPVVRQTLELWVLGSPYGVEDSWRIEAKGMLESASEAGLLDSNSKEHDVQSNPNR